MLKLSPKGKLTCIIHYILLKSDSMLLWLQWMVAQVEGCVHRPCSQSWRTLHSSLCIVTEANGKVIGSTRHEINYQLIKIMLHHHWKALTKCSVIELNVYIYLVMLPYPIIFYLIIRIIAKVDEATILNAYMSRCVFYAISKSKRSCKQIPIA